jgi:hypothetical protein
MPHFSEIGDSTAVNNSYSDKIVVYVEAADDATAFYGITGHSIREYLEFLEPREIGRGAEPVIAQVRADRPTNPKVFGLVDGEVAASFDGTDQLIDCTDHFFQIDRPELAGVVFLAEYEMENILMLYGEFPELMRRDVKLRDFDSLALEEAQARIAKVAQLFFLAALLKFASITFRHRAIQQGQAGCRTIDSGRFQRPAKPLEILGEIRQDVENEALISWTELKAEVRRSHHRLRNRLMDSGADRAGMQRERLRLADGKAVLTRLRADHSQHGHWDGHLLSSIGGTPFSALFRDQLLAITGAL